MSDGPLVIALGGNALKGQPGSLALTGLKKACATLSGYAGSGLVITHGSGPQIGLLSLSHSGDRKVTLDVLDAEVEGWLGYLIEQELDNCLDEQSSPVTLLTRIEVDSADPAFKNPSKPVGPWMPAADAKKLADRLGWNFLEGNCDFKRIVPSPLPRRILQASVVSELVKRGHAVICAGGGGIPVIRDRLGRFQGVEAVIDKDLASALLAIQLDARLLVMATDVPGIYKDWDATDRELINRISADRLAELELAPGSMGPKATAARNYVNATGNIAVVGALNDLSSLIELKAGTRVFPSRSL
ncbi:MAG: carbamate kinase [Gammaproteobacteria bacterium]